MQYRQRSVLFAAPWLIIGAAAVGASGITIADFERPELLIAALFVGIIIGMAVVQFLTATSRQGGERKRGRARRKGAGTSASYRAPGFRPQLLSHRPQSMPPINFVS